MTECAVLFSGGKDSFAAAIKMRAKGYRIYLLSCDNGCMSGVANFSHGAERLKKVFGSSVSHEVVSIAESVHELRQSLCSVTVSELAKEYPHILPYQLDCLICHSAMYQAAIWYCLSHGISVLVDGGRISQKFIVELPEMVEQYRELGEAFGIQVLFPLLDIEGDEEIDYIMASYGFVPKVLEPQCWVGCPVRAPLTDEQKQDLVRYFIDHLKPTIQKGIRRGHSEGF